MLAPEIYIQHIHVNMKNKKVLYMKLKKYLYRCLKNVFLFYQKLSSDLRKKWFSINSYDLCVAKKKVNGK